MDKRLARGVRQPFEVVSFLGRLPNRWPTGAAALQLFSRFERQLKPYLNIVSRL